MKLIDVFYGSDIETNYIASILLENGINYIKENMLNQSISAGWASESTFNNCRIRVAIDDFDRAKEIINEYIKASRKFSQ